MEQGQGKELRRYRRVPFAGAAVVVSTEEIRMLAVRDIGAGGAFLLSPRSPQVGSPVRVELELAARRFTATGLVIRDETTGAPEERAGFAVRFDRPDEAIESTGLVP